MAKLGAVVLGVEAGMQKIEAAYDQNFADLNNEELSLTDKFGNLFLNESTVAAPVEPIAPTAPIKPDVPNLGMFSYVGLSRHEPAQLEQLSAYDKAKAEYDVQKAEYDKQLLSYQQQKAKYEETHQGYKTFQDGVIKASKNVKPRPLEEEIKRDAGGIVSSYKELDAKAKVKVKVKVEDGDAKSRIERTESRQKLNDFTRPIVTGYATKARTAAEAHYNSEKAKLSKVADHQEDPRNVAWEMKQAIARREAAKLKPK